MRKLFILYNVIFLLSGQLVFALHHLHDHTLTENNTAKEKIEECIECIIYNSNNNYILNTQEITFLNEIISPYSYTSKTIFISDVKSNFSPRAPPIF